MEGWLDAQGVRCRYHTFPYEFTEARGRTTFSPRGLDLDLTARHGPAHATATGHVNRAAHATGFDLTISGTNVPLDGDLAAALPSKYRRLWDQTDPTGSCDVTVRLQREDGPPELPENPPTETFISADLGDGSSILLEPGKRLEQATGHFEIAEGFIEIQDLRGYLEGSPAMIAGTVGVDSGEADVRIAVSDVPVKRSISVEERADDTPAQINFDGQADVAGRIHTAGEPGTRSDAYVVHLRRGMLTGFDPELQWGDCHGRLIISDRESVIGSFEARQGAARLTAAGTLPGSKGGPVTLDVNIAQAKMETLARQLVPPRWRAQVEALGLGGLGMCSSNCGRKANRKAARSRSRKFSCRPSTCSRVRCRSTCLTSKLRRALRQTALRLWRLKRAAERPANWRYRASCRTAKAAGQPDSARQRAMSISRPA